MHAPSEPALAALQSQMAAALLAVTPEAQQLPPELFAGAHPGAVGLRVHRNTLLGAISNALRMSFSAVDRLVGEEFFDRMAVEYARAMPPRVPQLDEYGSGFAAYIERFPGTENLPYLAELAAFDWQVAALGRLCHASEGGAVLELEGHVRLTFATPLRTHRAAYPVGQLRAAILAEDLETLRAVDLTPGEYRYALWRSDQGVNVRAVSVVSARFLDAALSGADGTAALAAAGEVEQSAAEVVATLAKEILPAGFVRVETIAPQSV